MDRYRVSKTYKQDICLIYVTIDVWNKKLSFIYIMYVCMCVFEGQQTKSCLPVEVELKWLSIFCWIIKRDFVRFYHLIILMSNSSVQSILDKGSPYYLIPHWLDQVLWIQFKLFKFICLSMILSLNLWRLHIKIKRIIDKECKKLKWSQWD